MKEEKMDELLREKLSIEEPDLNINWNSDLVWQKIQAKQRKSRFLVGFRYAAAILVIGIFAFIFNQSIDNQKVVAEINILAPKNIAVIIPTKTNILKPKKILKKAIKLIEKEVEITTILRENLPEEKFVLEQEKVVEKPIILAENKQENVVVLPEKETFENETKTLPEIIITSHVVTLNIPDADEEITSQKKQKWQRITRRFERFKKGESAATRKIWAFLKNSFVEEKY